MVPAPRPCSLQAQLSPGVKIADQNALTPEEALVHSRVTCDSMLYMHPITYVMFGNTNAMRAIFIADPIPEKGIGGDRSWRQGAGTTRVGESMSMLHKLHGANAQADQYEHAMGYITSW